MKKLTPLKKGEKFVLDDAFEPFIYLITFPNPNGPIISSIKVIGMNDQKVKKTLMKVFYLAVQILKNMQVESLLTVGYDTSAMTIFFEANDSAKPEEALEYDVENGHFHVSQALSTVLTSKFKNIVVI